MPARKIARKSGKKAPKRESKDSICRRVGISRPGLDEWIKKGCDPWDEASIMEFCAGLRVDHKQRLNEPYRSATAPEDGENYNYNESRAKREHFQAELARLKYEVEEGRYTETEIAESMFQKAGLATRTMLQKLPIEVTPLVAGLDSAKTAKALEQWAFDKSQEIADAYEHLYREAGKEMGERVQDAKASSPRGVGGKKRPPAK